MILSIHIPKAAGLSFAAQLAASFGARAFFDYGDFEGVDTPELVARRKARWAAMRARRDELLSDCDVIHGHFVADKYLGLFPKGRFAAFFRDPYQQAVSHFQFLMRNPTVDHPAVRRFHEERMTLTEFIAAFPNAQSMFLGELAVEDMAMVGLTEQRERSVALFEAVFGHRLSPTTTRENVNPDRQGDFYPIEPVVRKAVDAHRARDVEAYRHATERFERLVARYGL